MNRIQWTENLTCPGCGKMGKVTLSGAKDPNSSPGERDRVEQGCAGFATVAVGLGFQFRCVACKRNAKVTRGA